VGVWRRARGGPEGAARPPNHVNSPCKRARVAGRGAAPAVALAWASTRACQPVRCPRWVAAQTSAGVCAAQTPAPAATVCRHAHVAVLRWFLFLLWTRRRGRRGGGGNLQERPPPPWGALDPPGGHGRAAAGRSATRRSPAPCVAAGHRGSPASAIKPLSAVVGARQTSRGCPSRAWRPPAHRRQLPMRCSQTRSRPRGGWMALFPLARHSSCARKAPSPDRGSWLAEPTRVSALWPPCTLTWRGAAPLLSLASPATVDPPRRQARAAGAERRRAGGAGRVRGSRAPRAGPVFSRRESGRVAASVTAPALCRLFSDESSLSSGTTSSIAPFRNTRVAPRVRT